MLIQYDKGPDSIGVEGFGLVRRGIATDVPDGTAESLLKKERLGFYKVTEKPKATSRKAQGDKKKEE